MALKFYRRQKVFPGVYLNFSSKGISTTVGMKGLSVNIGKSGTYLNTGIPGTGISSRKKISQTKNSIPASRKPKSYAYVPSETIDEIKSEKANSLTSKGLEGMKASLIAAIKEKEDIKREALGVRDKVKKAKALKTWSKVFIIGFFNKWFDENYSEKSIYFEVLKKQYANCKVNIEIEMDEDSQFYFEKLKIAFDELITCDRIWDKTASIKNDDPRSSSSSTISRNVTTISYQKLPFLNTAFEALYFKNVNGSNIYFYPGFVVFYDDKKSFGLIELSELEISFRETNFLEEETVPKDSNIVGEKWAKENNNGTPDKRFKINYKIPIVKYGELHLKTKTGVNEVFLFSNLNKAEVFYKAYISNKNQL